MKVQTPILSKAQKYFFFQEGYLAIDSITSNDDIERITKSYDRIFSQREGRSEGNQFDLGSIDDEKENAVLPQILDPSKYAPELNDSLLLKNAKIIVKQLLGGL